MPLTIHGSYWGREAKTNTNRERVVLPSRARGAPHHGPRFHGHTGVVLPVCEQPASDFPGDNRLHRLLVTLLDINMQVEPLLHACL